jgi:hypothetical protein
MKFVKFWLLAALITLPTFGLMLKSGIYTMHDPHLFRVQQFDACVSSGVFPCRWAADSGKGFGEPLFNFYAQFPYWLTQSFRFLGFSLIDSAKSVYILSLVASAVSMYFLSRRFFGRNGGILSSVIYTFAPYRAVDIWVRGALPEALAFIFYPLIILFLDDYLKTRKIIPLVFFSFSLALLLTTHNLSVLMFSPFLFLFWLIRSWKVKDFTNLRGLIPALIFALLLSSYYLLPVVFERGLVTIEDTISGYYDYRIHFATLRELFVSRFWGYGASLWAQKFLSISVGQIQWLLPLFICCLLLVRRIRQKTNYILFLQFFILGLAALFLTHGKSSLIWNSLPIMKYIQFPWRFLTIGVFFLSLSAGAFSQIMFPRFRILIPVAIVLAILSNVSFFRPDIWRDIHDADLVSGPLWDEGRSSSLTDFWPKSAPKPPVVFATLDPEFLMGSGTVVDANKTSGLFTYSLSLDNKSSIRFPVVYFPGWKATDNDQPLALEPTGDNGLITAALEPGEHRIILRFTNTPVRSWGNIISLLALLSTPLWFLKKSIG